MALAEYRGSSGKELLLGFITGFDSECILGRYVGPSHYARGFHATATLGTFGAAAGCAKLLGLDHARVINALGIAATQAAGLKSMFGSMCKPFHAGNAAANGLLAADLASRGFDSQQAAIEIAQGFGATHSDTLSVAKFEQALRAGSYVPTTLFKYHAACYLTHSALEAARQLVIRHGLTPAMVKRAVVTVSDGHFSVCNIQEPDSGLEAKFSLRFACAMALSGIDTAAIDSFSDVLVSRPDLIALRDRIEIRAFASPRAESLVYIELIDGRQLEQAWDVAIPETDLALQWKKLQDKFVSLVAPVLGNQRASAIVATVDQLEQLENVAELAAMVRG
jgi:2-methylcitrate dehydratase PrpD